jgi:hypothetical protein
MSVISVYVGPTDYLVLYKLLLLLLLLFIIIIIITFAAVASVTSENIYYRINWNIYGYSRFLKFAFVSQLVNCKTLKFQRSEWDNLHERAIQSGKFKTSAL